MTIKSSGSIDILSPGTPFDAYIIQQRLDNGAGRRGTFLAISQKMPDCQVVLKIWPAEIEQNDQDRQHWEREFHFLRHMKHQNIQRIITYGHADTYEAKQPFIVTQYYDGRTLEDLAQPTIPPWYALPVMTPIADALAYAHDNGILHRNINPSSIIAGERPILVGFGKAKSSTPEHTPTTSGEMSINPYTAPELRQHPKAHSTQSDIYAYGMTLLTSLVGDLPPHYHLILMKEHDPLPIREHNEAIKPALENILNAMLDYEPKKRGTMRAIHDALKSQQKDYNRF